MGDPLTRVGILAASACGWPGGDRGDDGGFTVEPTRSRILLVEDDLGTAETFAWALRLEGYEVYPAQSGAEALAAFRRAPFDLLLLDMQHPDMPGLEIVHQLRADGANPPFFVISGHVSVPFTVEVMRLGARTVFEKPLDVEELLATVRSIVGAGSEPREVASSRLSLPPAGVRTRSGPRRAPRDTGATRSRPIAERWASLVLQVMQSDCDPKTMAHWARVVCVSRTVLCECCRLIHVPPHDARDFARIARAIYQSGDRWEPEALMDVADARTLKKLLRHAGLAEPITQAPTLPSFFERQLWIPRDNPAIAALSRLLEQEP